MQIMITHGSMARTRVLHYNRWQLGLALAGLVLLLLVLLSGSVYHFVFLKAVREGWPLVSQLVRPIVQDEMTRRERFLRDNLNAMVQEVGEMQVRLIRLESMGDRVSGLGVRADPITGRAALHAGLDFPAEVGTVIVAAAGGVVQSTEWHPVYGQLLEIDHGRGLVTRYAHASAVLVRRGDVVKRGQRMAEVGSSGRSTGSHLHFEVLVDGVPQDPARFLYVARADLGPVAARKPG